MFLLIVAGGTLFVRIFIGEKMREHKDSLGRELSGEDAVYCFLTFGSSKNFPSSSEKTSAGNRNTWLPEEKTNSITDLNFGLNPDKNGDFLINQSATYSFRIRNRIYALLRYNMININRLK